MAILGTFAFEEDFLAAARNLTSSGFDNVSLALSARRLFPA